MNLKSLDLRARFCNFAVISVEIQMKQIEMKQKFLAIILIIGAGLFTACTVDDYEVEPDNWKPQTEIWTVTIEPEFVIGNSCWGNYAIQVPQMEGHIENSDHTKNGEKPIRFCMNEISGFSFKEGYRYRLKIEATTTNPKIMDGPAYTFKLKEVLSTQHVGIRTEGRREVTMDLQRIMMKPIGPDPNGLLFFICGNAIDGSETLNFGLYEIYGANDEMFHQYDQATEGFNFYNCRWRLSITPAECPIQGKHQYRVRMEEMISQRVIPEDSCLVFAPKEEFEAVESELYLY